MPTFGGRPTRREILLGAAATASLLLPRLAEAQGPAITVYKSPTCGCCSGWADHLRHAGYGVTTIDTEDLHPIKVRLRVPADLESCHTASVDGYTLEGHVPAHAVQRLLRERPDVVGLAVPGMPEGSPGMETGRAELYEVVAFADARREVFGRYRGQNPA